MKRRWGAVQVPLAGCEPTPLPAFSMRAMLVVDMNRLLSDYITHYRPMVKEHDKAVYSVGMQKRFARLAKKSRVLIAYDPDPAAMGEKRDILGWIMYRRWQTKALILHYVYVRQAYRGQGLGRALLAAAGWRPGMPIVATHRHRLYRKQLGNYDVVRNEFILEELSEWTVPEQ